MGRARTDDFHSAVALSFVAAVVQPVTNVVTPHGQRCEHLVAHAVGLLARGSSLLREDLDANRREKVLVALLDALEHLKIGRTFRRRRERRGAEGGYVARSKGDRWVSKT